MPFQLLVCATSLAYKTLLALVADDQAPGYRAKTVQLDASKDIAMLLSMKRRARSQAVVERPEAPTEEPAKSKPGRFKRSFDAVKHVWLGN